MNAIDWQARALAAEAALDKARSEMSHLVEVCILRGLLDFAEVPTDQRHDAILDAIDASVKSRTAAEAQLGALRDALALAYTTMNGAWGAARPRSVIATCDVVANILERTASAAAGWCRIEERDAAIRERDEARAELRRRP